MKTISIDAVTIGLVAGAMPADEWALVVYDGVAITGPDTVIDSVSALDLGALRKAELIAYAARRRYEIETGGTAINGVAVATDRTSQAMLNAAYNIALGNAQFSTMWKGTDGAFTAIDAPTMIALAQAVGMYVAACFSAEAAVVNGINVGNITTKAQIDAALTI
jgi:hypothetical protein